MSTSFRVNPEVIASHHASLTQHVHPSYHAAINEHFHDMMPKEYSVEMAAKENFQSVAAAIGDSFRHMLGSGLHDVAEISSQTVGVAMKPAGPALGA